MLLQYTLHRAELMFASQENISVDDDSKFKTAHSSCNTAIHWLMAISFKYSALQRSDLAISWASTKKTRNC